MTPSLTIFPFRRSKMLPKFLCQESFQSRRPQIARSLARHSRSSLPLPKFSTPYLALLSPEHNDRQHDTPPPAPDTYMSLCAALQIKPIDRA